jgi:hypothetical protein
MVDEKTGDTFRFDLLTAEERDAAGPAYDADGRDGGWLWQREILETLLRELRVIFLKARQIGITWTIAGFGLWIALTKPGTLVLVYRQKEDEAKKLIARIWQMYQGLPEHLRFGVTVIKPAYGKEPSTEIHFRHPDGRISRMVGMASTASAGHGETAALVLVDEGAYVDKLRAIWKAINSTVGEVGRLVVVSTGNGVSNAESGDGNFFHRLWVTAKERLFHQVFLSWRVHPNRDDHWYATSPEVQALDVRDRKEQYPANPEEAFALADDIWYDPDDLDFYAEHRTRRKIAPSFEFERADATHARKIEKRNGIIDLYVAPTAGHKYAIFADVATAHGRDHSAAYVIDLGTAELCAELHSPRLDEASYAFQLHYLGKMFRGSEQAALLAVENQNGWGEAVLIMLRDGREGRPPYPNLYRHEDPNRRHAKESTKFGYPTNEHTRGLMINQLGRAMRERTLPFLTPGLHSELLTFVRRDRGPSPAAMDGCHDDRVIAACGSLELFRQFGAWPDMHKPKRRKPTKQEIEASWRPQRKRKTTRSQKP